MTYHLNKNFLPNGDQLTFELLTGRINKVYPNYPITCIRKSTGYERDTEYELNWINSSPQHHTTAIEIHEELFGEEWDWAFDTYEHKQVNSSVVYERYTIVRRRKDGT